jgi:cytoskeletal protein RodZ
MEEKTELSIGKYLKGVRETGQLTIREISERTRLHEKFLLMIEADNYDGMGGTGYAKAMVMSYARALKANEKLVLHKFNSKFGNPQPEVQRQRFKHQQHRKIMIPTSAFYIIIMIVLVVILTFVILNLHKNGQLNFSLRKQIKEGSGQKVNLLDKPTKRSVSLYDSLQEAKQQEHKKETSGKKAVTIDMAALRDSTDYTDEYLFEGEDSPFNVKE